MSPRSGLLLDSGGICSMALVVYIVFNCYMHWGSD